MVVDGAEAGAAVVVHVAAHAPHRQAGELGQRFLEQVDVAGEQRAQDQPGGQLAVLAASGSEDQWKEGGNRCFGLEHGLRILTATAGLGRAYRSRRRAMP